MNRVFVDTSAVLALLVATDRAHGRARAALERLKAARAPLVTTSYVLVETYALIQNRLGMEAVRAFRAAFAPLLEIVWIDEQVHEKALDALIGRGDRELSLVDATSFAVMRAQGIDQAFAFDRDFAEEGFGL